MSVSKEEVQAVLQKIALPDGGDLMSRDFVRALSIRESSVQFVIEAPNPDIARLMEPLRKMAKRPLRRWTA